MVNNLTALHACKLCMRISRLKRVYVPIKHRWHKTIKKIGSGVDNLGGGGVILFKWDTK